MDLLKSLLPMLGVCHSEGGTTEESPVKYVKREILRGACPERGILRYAQNDKRRAQDDNEIRVTRCQRGVTLIEAVLMIAILGAGLIGVLYVFSGSTRGALLADQTVIASNLAKEKLEQIIADRATKGYAATIATSYSDGTLTGDYNEFTRNVTITEVDPDDDNSVDDFLDASGGSGYARVTVVIGWAGGTESVKLETLIADYAMP